MAGQRSCGNNYCLKLNRTAKPCMQINYSTVDSKYFVLKIIDLHDPLFPNNRKSTVNSFFYVISYY